MKFFKQVICYQIFKSFRFITHNIGIVKKINLGGYRYELNYLRDKEGREVDFVIVKEGKIEELIEVKLQDDKISNSLKYYVERLKPKIATQIVYGIKDNYSQGGIKVVGPLDAPQLVQL